MIIPLKRNLNKAVLLDKDDSRIYLYFTLFTLKKQIKNASDFKCSEASFIN